jgi:hypothetical protein
MPSNLIFICTMHPPELLLLRLKTLSTSDNYAHILKGLLLNSPVQLDGATSYTLELSASGYTYGTSSYMGWVKNHENIFFDIDGTPENDFNNPHTFFLYELRNI